MGNAAAHISIKGLYLKRWLTRKPRSAWNYHLAVADFSKANELAPHDPDTLNWIAWLKATNPHEVLRNGKEALTASLEACQLTSFKNAGYLDTLAAAYAENGDFDQATHYITKAIGMKVDVNERKDFQTRLALYRDREPYRQTESARRSQTRR
jgi:tetratricopeptide (TPR) repeat protein